MSFERTPRPRRGWRGVLAGALLCVGACVRSGFEAPHATSDAAGPDTSTPSDTIVEQDDRGPQVLAFISEHVSAMHNIYGAGHSSPPAPGGGGAGLLPVAVALPAGIDRYLVFSASGTVDNGAYLSGPDGTRGPIGTYTHASWGGIAGMTTHDGCGMLIGVLLDDAEPSDPPPPPLDVGDGSFAQLSPGLKQCFFIGDGLSGEGSGQQQRFFVPDSATRLYLGYSDSSARGNPPGSYADNSATMTWTVSAALVGRGS